MVNIVSTLLLTSMSSDGDIKQFFLNFCINKKLTSKVWNARRAKKNNNKFANFIIMEGSLSKMFPDISTVFI